VKSLLKREKIQISNMNDKPVYQKFIQDVFRLHSEVRYAELFDEECRSLAGGMRPGVVSIDPPEVSERVDVDTARFGLMLLKHKKYYGSLNYIYVEMEKVNVVVLPVGEKILVVALNPTIGLNIIPKLKKVIAKLITH